MEMGIQNPSKADPRVKLVIELAQGLKRSAQIDAAGTSRLMAGRVLVALESVAQRETLSIEIADNGLAIDGELLSHDTSGVPALTTHFRARGLRGVTVDRDATLDDTCRFLSVVGANQELLELLGGANEVLRNQYVSTIHVLEDTPESQLDRLLDGLADELSGADWVELLETRRRKGHSAEEERTPSAATAVTSILAWDPKDHWEVDTRSGRDENDDSVLERVTRDVVRRVRGEGPRSVASNLLGAWGRLSFLENNGGLPPTRELAETMERLDPLVRYHLMRELADTSDGRALGVLLTDTSIATMVAVALLLVTGCEEDLVDVMGTIISGRKDRASLLNLVQSRLEESRDYAAVISWEQVREEMLDLTTVYGVLAAPPLTR